MIPIRRWCVCVTLDEGAAISVAITADQQLLLPVRSFTAPTEALLHVEVVLADSRKGDPLAAVVKAPEIEDKMWSAARRESLLSWLGPTLLEVWQHLLVGDGAAGVRTPDKASGVVTRPEVEVPDKASSQDGSAE